MDKCLVCKSTGYRWTQTVTGYPPTIGCYPCGTCNGSGWLKEQFKFSKEQVDNLPEFKKEPIFQRNENIMSNVTNLKKNVIPTTTAFDFLSWESQTYYTIYKDGDPIMHCHLENIDPEGEPMAGIYVMRDGESVFKLDFGIELVEVVEKADHEIGDLLVRLMGGDQFQQTLLYAQHSAACNNPDNDE
jgi:hypothetical protein